MILSKTLSAQLLWRDIQTHTDTGTHRHTFKHIGLSYLEDMCKLQRHNKIKFFGEQIFISPKYQDEQNIQFLFNAE